MKKRSLTILFVLLLLLIPTTLAYWIQVNPPESVTSNVEIKVDFDYGPPKGIIEWDRHPNIKFNNGDIVQGTDKEYFYLVNNSSKCYWGKCPDPGTQKASDNPYKALTVKWVPEQLYRKGEVVVHNNRVYMFTKDISNTNDTPPNLLTYEGWKLISDIKFSKDPNHKDLRYKHDYLQIEDNKAVILNTNIYHKGDEPFPQHAYYKDLTFTEHYASGKTYPNKVAGGVSFSQVVFHEGMIFRTQNVELANHNAPGSLYGAWNRIDSIEWTNYNVYKQGDIVTHNGFVYKASADGVRNEPGKVSPQWIIQMEVNFQENVVYKKGHVVIYRNQVYTAQQDITDGTIPGSDSKKWK